jgi:hypothetical protein
VTVTHLTASGRGAGGLMAVAPHRSLVLPCAKSKRRTGAEPGSLERPERIERRLDQQSTARLKHRYPVRCGLPMCPMARYTCDPVDRTAARGAAPEYVDPSAISTKELPRRRHLGLRQSSAYPPVEDVHVRLARQSLRDGANSHQTATSICSTVHAGSRISRPDRKRNLSRGQLFCTSLGAALEPVDRLPSTSSGPPRSPIGTRDPCRWADISPLGRCRAGATDGC